MADDAPFALFLSWTCYGTWLPGDPRGYVSNTRHSIGGFAPKENVPGTPYTADDPFAHKRAHVFQKGTTVRLTLREARWAAESFVAAAAKRGWRIVRGAIMANHVHLVVCDCPDDGPAVQRIFKGVSQAELSKKAARRQRWWTRRGSDRYLHTNPAIQGAIRYVAKQQYKLVEIIDMQIVISERTRRD
jgi:REP element-mobilizing transposase RayT